MARVHDGFSLVQEDLRGLDHFRSTGAPRDGRLAEAIALVHERRRGDGRWALPRGYPGAVHLELEPGGGPSRINSLRCLRVLDWWEGRDTA